MNPKRRIGTERGRDIRALKARLAAAEHTAQARQRTIEAMHRIAALTLRKQLLPDVLRLAVQEVSAWSSFPIVAVECYDAAQQVMELVAVTGLALPADPDALRVPVSQSLSGRVAQRGRAIVEQQTLDRPVRTPGALGQIGLRTVVCLPLISGEQVIGALTLAHSEAVPLDAGLVPLAQSLATAIAALVARWQTEAELQVALTKYRTLFGSFPLGITISDASGQIVEANAMAEELLGLGREEQRRREIDGAEWRIVRRDGSPMPAEEYASVRALREQRIVGNVEMGVVTPGGTTTWINVTAAPLPLAGYGVVITYGDISERLSAERALLQSESKLRHSEEHLRLVLRTTSDGFWIVDTSHRFLEVNQTYCTMSGYTREEFLQLSISDLEALESLGETEARMRQIVREGSARFETQHRRKDGSLLDVEVSVNVLDPARGTLICFCRDITKRKQAELALRASEEQYRGLMESLDSAVALVDGGGRFLYMNDVAARQIGGVPGDFIGRTMHALFPEPSAAAQFEHICTVIREDRGLIDEHCREVQGQPRWYRSSIQPIHDVTGQAVCALVNSSDIHDLKMAQQELQELNQTLEERIRQRTAEVQDLYEHAPAGYHSLDGDGALVMINQTELDWLGYAREELIGRPIVAIMTPASQVTFAANFPTFKQRGWARDQELELIRKDGSSFPVLVSATAIYDAAGTYLMSRSTVADLTERKAAEAALHQMNAELSRAVHARDEFLATMSHELRTPLNTILGWAEMLAEQIPGPLTERQRQSVHHIAESGQHLLALINDILDLAKIEAGKLELELAPTDVVLLCQQSRRLIAERATRKRIGLIVTLDPQVCLMQADERRLKQVLVNLLTNAVKFTPEGGHVGLEVQGDAERQAVTFTVWDTGIGIAPDDQRRLFKPFVQIDSALNRAHAGTGLGLALVLRLTALHGGSIALISQPGAGSRFSVTLPWAPPLVESSAAEAPVAGALAPLVVAGAGAPTPPVILLAEDHEQTRALHTDMLSAAGYTVIVARNGLEAVSLATERFPALILMDIQMPLLDGLEATRRLRAAGLQDTPIIALTALAMRGDRERCLAAGATDYLAKPVSLRSLLSLVGTQLQVAPSCE